MTFPLLGSVATLVLICLVWATFREMRKERLARIENWLKEHDPGLEDR